jgi:hypothetical protein
MGSKAQRAGLRGTRQNKHTDRLVVPVRDIKKKVASALGGALDSGPFARVP